MSSTSLPGFFARVAIAFAAYFRVLFDPAFAAGVAHLRTTSDARALESGEPKKRKKGGDGDGDGERESGEKLKGVEKAAKKRDKASAPAPILRAAGPEAALQLLALLQREGRFVDFLEEDVASFPDAQIGAAARVVHEKCRAALREHFPLEPVRTEAEGATIKLDKGFDAARVRVVGNVVGEPPFSGTLVHRGWRVREVRLPKMTEGHDPAIVAPAEVEL